MKKIKINIPEKYKKYLPSKKFSFFILILIVVILIFFLISNLFFGKSSFLNEQKEAKLAVQKSTLNDLLQKDSDGDGILDWEEGLWGTDPYNTKTFDNILDSEYIKLKREASRNGEKISLNENLNETEKFSQQFFASILALEQTGELDQETLIHFSSSLGEKIADSTIINAYQSSDIKISSNNTSQDQLIYYLKIANLFEKQKEKGVGDEMDLISILLGSSNMPSSQTSEIQEKLNLIANSYQDYSLKMLDISVPQNLSLYHLKMINNSNNTGIAVKNMAQVLIDPVIGLSGISQYQKYSDDFLSSIEELEDILIKNGTIN